MIVKGKFARCPDCGGAGKVEGIIARIGVPKEEQTPTRAFHECSECEGTGKVDADDFDDFDVKEHWAKQGLAKLDDDDRAELAQLDPADMSEHLRPLYDALKAEGLDEK